MVMNGVLAAMAILRGGDVKTIGVMVVPRIANQALLVVKAAM